MLYYVILYILYYIILYYINITNTLMVPIRIEFEAGWAPEPVGTICKI